MTQNNKPYEKALESLMKVHVNQQDWISNPNDFQKVVAVFNRFLSDSFEVSDVDDISNYLVSLGVNHSTAFQVQLVYQTLLIQQYLPNYPLPFKQQFWDDVYKP